MVELVRQKRPFLYMLRYAGENRKARIHILKNLSDAEVQVLLELVANTLYGVIPTSKNDKVTLKRHKRFMLNLLASTTPLERKKFLMVKYHTKLFEFLCIIFNSLEKFVWHQG